MFRLKSVSVFASLVLGALAAAFCVRYLAALDNGVAHLSAIRTIFFWAAVCAPVAILADVLVRDIMNYRLVKVAVARVKTRR